MQKVNVTEVIKDFDGKEIKNEDGSLLTYRRLLWMSLNQPDKDDNADMKYRLYRLINKIMNNDELEFIAEDITLINSKVAKNATPIVVGRVKELLEPPKE